MGTPAEFPLTDLGFPQNCSYSSGETVVSTLTPYWVEPLGFYPRPGLPVASPPGSQTIV